MASFASSATMCGARKHAWTIINFCFELYVGWIAWHHTLSTLSSKHTTTDSKLPTCEPEINQLKSLDRTTLRKESSSECVVFVVSSPD